MATPLHKKTPKQPMVAVTPRSAREGATVSINREDKIQFIKDGLSKGSLDNLLLTLETHPSGDVHRAIHDLWPIFIKNMIDLVLEI